MAQPWKYKTYRRRADHSLHPRDPAVLHLLDKAVALRRAVQFLAGQFHEDVQMFETVHNCELFECCGRLSSLPCKELKDFTLQSGRDEIIFKSQDLRDLHLIPGLEEIYSRRVVLGAQRQRGW